MEYLQGVGAVVAAALTAAGEDGIGIGPPHYDAAPQGVDTLVVSNAGYQGDVYRAGVRQVQHGGRRTALCAVGQQPPEGLYGLAGA